MPKPRVAKAVALLWIKGWADRADSVQDCRGKYWHSDFFDFHAVLGQPRFALRIIGHGVFQPPPERGGGGAARAGGRFRAPPHIRRCRGQQDRFPVEIQPVALNAQH